MTAAPNPWTSPPDDEWDDDPPPPPPAAPVVPLVYPDVGEWVTRWLSPLLRRELTDSQLWCAHWFRHAEAIDRLEGAWRAWEHLRRPVEAGGDEWLGTSTWWSDHGDPCLDRLLALNGPFRHCSKGHSEDLAPLPCAEVPPGLFDR